MLQEKHNFSHFENVKILLALETKWFEKKTTHKSDKSNEDASHKKIMIMRFRKIKH